MSEQLNGFASKPQDSEFVNSQLIRILVIPAEAGIQTIFKPEPKTNLDAVVRRHDDISH